MRWTRLLVLGICVSVSLQPAYQAFARTRALGLVRVQGLPTGATEKDVRNRCSTFGHVLWMRDIGQGCCLVRYTKQEDVDAMVASTNGAVWAGAQLSAARYSMGTIESPRCATSRQRTLPARFLC